MVTTREALPAGAPDREVVLAGEYMLVLHPFAVTEIGLVYRAVV